MDRHGGAAAGRSRREECEKSHNGHPIEVEANSTQRKKDRKAGCSALQETVVFGRSFRSGLWLVRKFDTWR